MKYKHLFFFLITNFLFTRVSLGEEITRLIIPRGQKLADTKIEGAVEISSHKDQNKIIIGKNFYAADSHGFSKLPTSSFVTPLQLGYVKLGGSLHATYNWEYNAYYNNNAIQYAYAPLVERLDYIKKNYLAEPMFQINMLGWQPDRDIPSGMLIYKNSADSKHAADAITYLNGSNKLGLKNIMMGNEPFESEEYHDIPVPSADDYIDKYISYALAMREAQEALTGNPNDIKLWGPEINTGWTNWQTNNLPDCIMDYDQIEKARCSYGNGKFKEFIPYFLNRLSEFENDPIKNPKKYKMLDYLTFHYYSLFRTNFQDNNSIIKDSEGYQNVAGMLESTNIWDSETYVNRYDAASPKRYIPRIIPKFKEWARKYYPAASVAVTEFGIDSVDKIQYHPIVRPLYLADLVARCANAGLDTFINSFLQSGDVSNSWAMIDKGKKTPIYQVYSLFTNYYLGEALKAQDNFEDKLNSYAIKTKNGTNVFLVNKDIASHALSLTLEDKGGIQQTITELSVPAWTLMVVVIPDNKSEGLTAYQYGAKEMGIEVNSKVK